MHNGGENINLATSGKLTFNNTPIVERGSNSNGTWVKFYDGTAMVVMEAKGDVVEGNNQVVKTLPITLHNAYFVANMRSTYVSTHRVNLYRITRNGTSTVLFNMRSETSTNYSAYIFGIGNWR